MDIIGRTMLVVVVGNVRLARAEEGLAESIQGLPVDPELAHKPCMLVYEPGIF